MIVYLIDRTSNMACCVDLLIENDLNRVKCYALEVASCFLDGGCEMEQVFEQIQHCTVKVSSDKVINLSYPLRHSRNVRCSKHLKKPSVLRTKGHALAIIHLNHLYRVHRDVIWTWLIERVGLTSLSNFPASSRNLELFLDHGYVYIREIPPSYEEATTKVETTK